MKSTRSIHSRETLDNHPRINDHSVFRDKILRDGAARKDRTDRKRDHLIIVRYPPNFLFSIFVSQVIRHRVPRINMVSGESISTDDCRTHMSHDLHQFKSKYSLFFVQKMGRPPLHSAHRTLRTRPNMDLDTREKKNGLPFGGCGRALDGWMNAQEHYSRKKHNCSHELTFSHLRRPK